MLQRKVSYDDVTVGQQMPDVIWHPTRRQLVQWAVASNDLYEIHFDSRAAQAAGLPDVVVHGRLKAAFLAHYAAGLWRHPARLTRWTCSYRGLDIPGSPLVCRGKIIEKYREGADRYAKLEIWTENAKGERTSVGTAVVAAIPGRDS